MPGISYTPAEITTLTKRGLKTQPASGMQAGNKFLASNSTNVTTTVANLMQALTGRADALRLDGVDWALYSDHDDYTVTAITVRDVVLGGLQSVTHLGPVKVLGQHTMGLSVAMDSLDVSVTVDVQLNALKTNASGYATHRLPSSHGYVRASCLTSSTIYLNGRALKSSGAFTARVRCAGKGIPITVPSTFET
jgi:hypothetical protein